MVFPYDVYWVLENFVYPWPFLVVWIATSVICGYQFLVWFSSNVLYKVWHLPGEGGVAIERPCSLSAAGDSISFFLPEMTESGGVAGFGSKKRTKITADIQKGAFPFEVRTGIRLKRVYVEYQQKVWSARDIFDVDKNPITARANVPLAREAMKGVVEAAKVKLEDMMIYMAMGGLGAIGIWTLVLFALGLLK